MEVQGVILSRQAAVLDGWEAAAGPGSPFASAAWADACAEALHGATPCFLVAGRADRPDAVAPFALRHDRIRRLELIGGRETGEPMDLLWRDAGALDAIAEAVVALGLPVALGRLPATSSTIGALPNAFTRRGLVSVRGTVGSPYLDLDERDVEPEHRLTARRRSDLRRMMRRAMDMGEVRTDLDAPDASTVDARVDAFLRIERSGWKGRAGTALALDPPRAALFRAAARRFAARGELRCAFLRIDGQRAAGQLAIERGGRTWLLKIGYDERFARCSPGTLLLRHAIAESAARGLRGFELLGGPETWLEPWLTGVRRCVSVRAWPLGVRGRRRRGRGRGDPAAPVVAVRGLWTAIVRRAGRRYGAGAELADALAVARRLPTTLCWWNPPEAHPIEVAALGHAAIAAIREERLPAAISLKGPALGFDPSLVDELAWHARTSGVALRFDALAPEQADAIHALATRAQAAGTSVGCTLPSRWRRSRSDAARLAEAGIAVRLVKGQWPDPGAETDPREGLRALAALLAGRVPHVAVATHDAPLAAEAIERLGDTPAELELLYGLPLPAPLAVARRLARPVRLYVPWGEARPPYRPSRARHGAEVARLFRDLIATGTDLRPLGDGSIRVKPP